MKELYRKPRLCAQFIFVNVCNGYPFSTSDLQSYSNVGIRFGAVYVEFWKLASLAKKRDKMQAQRLSCMNG